jgi:hypothetical protein
MPKRNYYLDDPLAAWCRQSIDPFEWSQAPYDPERCLRAAEVMNIAADFGLKKGFLVPIVRGNGFHACVTMAGEPPDCLDEGIQALTAVIETWWLPRFHDMVGEYSRSVCLN